LLGAVLGELLGLSVGVVVGIRDGSSEGLAVLGSGATVYVALGAGVGVYVGGYEDSETGELVGIVVRFSSTGTSVWCGLGE
jgi:hypothetical protein